jgi:hypothetical protein
MRILPQIASNSYSSSPGLLMLQAPRIAGLLPAPQPKVTIEKIIKPPKSHVFRNFAEWQAADEELAALFDGALQRLAALRPSRYAEVHYA